MSDQSKRLENTKKTMVNIVFNRKDGRKFVPIVLRLEQEFAAIQSDDRKFERILTMAAASAK